MEARTVSGLFETMRVLREHATPFSFESRPLNKTLAWGGVPAMGMWYLCGKCLGGEFHHRLSLNAKFCPECGRKISWKMP